MIYMVYVGSRLGDELNGEQDARSVEAGEYFVVVVACDVQTVPRRALGRSFNDTGT